MCASPDEGATRDNLRATATSHPDQTLADAKPCKIAIVDDDDGARTAMRFMLEVAEYAVVAFASAVEFLEQEIHELTCLILDHRMPGMTGLELAERLRADGVGIPIVLVTGTTSPGLIARASALGIRRVLEKPLLAQELLDVVKTAVS
jgi:two-component system, LuxR family, response regulator FixJ